MAARKRGRPNGSKDKAPRKKKAQPVAQPAASDAPPVAPAPPTGTVGVGMTDAPTDGRTAAEGPAPTAAEISAAQGRVTP